MKIYYRNANGQHEVNCDNCFYIQPTDINELFYCMLDGHTKDYDMSCDKFDPQE